MYKGKYSFTIYDGEEETLVALLDNCRQLAKYLNITLNCARNLANRLLDREYLILRNGIDYMLARIINDITYYENCLDCENSVDIDEYKATAKSLIGLKFVDRHGKTHTIMNYDTFHRVLVDENYCVFSKYDITYIDDDDILYKIRYKDIEAFKKYDTMEEYNKHENIKLYDNDWKYLKIAKQRGLI